MTKRAIGRMGITIRIGAAHDEVVGPDGSVFDRAAMRTGGHPQLQKNLRHSVTAAFCKFYSKPMPHYVKQYA